MKTATVQVATMATAQPRRRIPHRCRATTRGFRIRQTKPATAIINRTSRIRYASLPARYTRATTATVTRMVASGTPRLAAASRRRACRTCAAVTVSTGAGAAVAVSARAGLAGLAALMRCSPSCDEAGARTGRWEAGADARGLNRALRLRGAVPNAT